MNEDTIVARAVLASRQHHWIKHLREDFERNPDFQIRFHLVAMYFWMANAVAALVIFFVWPDLWLKIAVLYVLLLSLYANWDTDYDAVSAASSFKHAKGAEEKVSE